MLDKLQRLLRPVHARIANLVSRAVVSRVDDSTKLQTLQVDVGEDETREGLERFQQYGLTSVPTPGAEAVVLFVGGRRDVGYVVALDDRRYRVKGLAQGEVALYNKAGASVVLKADGSVEVNPATGQVVKLAGQTDAVALASKVNERFAHLEAAFNAHVHLAAGSPTLPPTAVPGVIPVETVTPPGGAPVVGSTASAKVKAG